MYCSQCGNEIKENELFCSQCGEKINKEAEQKKQQETVQNDVDREDNKLTKKIKIKIKWIIYIAIITLILIISTFIVTMIFKGNTINQDRVTEILKSSSNGIYLQDQTVKLGEITDINYKEYDKLISYSAVFINNEVTLKAGGFILYNTSNKNYYIIDNLQTDFISIIYYLNTQNMKDQLLKVNEITAKYIQEYGDGIFRDNEYNEQYAEMGKEIGKIVGVDLCRKIGENGLNDLANLNYGDNGAVFLYRKGEIFIRYIGIYTTTQQYAWQGIIDETSAKLIYNNNYKSYKNLVALYGNPYKNVTKFTIYIFGDDENANEIGTYNSLEEAKNKLNLEQSSDKAEIQIKNDDTTDVNNNLQSTSRIKLDIDKFIEELAEEYSITGNNGSTPIYRFNNGFYNQDLTLDSFQVSTENNKTTYSITTNRDETYKGTYILEITMTKDSYLDTITIKCETDEDNLHNIDACAGEVEDALSYAVYNTRKNDRAIDFIINELKLKNYIDKNTKILNSNFNINEYDSKSLKNVNFEIKGSEQILNIKY